MTFDEITAARRALYEQGGIEVAEVSSFGHHKYGRGAGRMMPIDETDEAAWQRAARYNWLAALHAKFPNPDIPEAYRSRLLARAG